MHRDALVDAIRADTPIPFGCANLPVGENNIIAVDIPDEATLERTYAFLVSRQASGDLDLEEACPPDRVAD
ncbi:hypothetical protein ACRCUN_21785 [Mycobacterium sp. LTG2003]